MLFGSGTNNRHGDEFEQRMSKLGQGLFPGQT